MPQPIALPVARGVTIQTSADGRATGLFFKTPKDETIGISIPNQELSRLIALLLEQAGRVAAQVTPTHPPLNMTATPILASHLGFAQGRSESEELISFRVGNVDLTFAVDVSMIQRQCTVLLSTSKKQEPQTKN
jgi:hypothetical protein